MSNSINPSAGANDLVARESAALRLAILAYGGLSYLVFFATFLYAIGFIGNFAVPTMLDGLPQMPWPQALAVDVGLLTLFALQHSIMARPRFKQWLVRFMPQAAERSTYVLMSSLALIAVFVWWQPLGGSIWQVQSSVGEAMLYGAYAAGWLLVLYATFLINHFDLFGLRQVWLAYTNRPYTELRFVTPWLYRIIRHPLYLGWLIVAWMTPVMTLTHLVFALLITGYIFVGVRFEERDLESAHEDYAKYKQSVPMIIPRMSIPRRNKTGQ